MSDSLRVFTLGGFSVERNGHVISNDEWPRYKTRDLLKVLLTSPDCPFAVEQLCEAIAPDASPRAALSNVRARISELRRSLEPGLARGRDSRFVARIGEAYTFRVTPDVWIDALEFESSVTSAQRETDIGNWADAVAAFEKALQLYRGEFLAEDRYEEWALAPRHRLQVLFLDSLETLATCFAELGRLRQAISCCRRILSVEPYRESVIYRLMQYQVESGQRAQALETYRRGTAALKSELGVDPSKKMLDLHREARKTTTHVGPGLDQRRIAVLPFVNYGPNPLDEYIADGMVEELIGCLSRVRDFRVIARTTTARYRESSESAAQIGRELRVGTLLEGSVRKIRDRVRISIQLIDTLTEDHLWAEEYERHVHDVLQLQKDVACAVASALQLRLSNDEARILKTERIVNAEAQDLYLKGRFSFGNRTIPHIIKAGECFRKALEIDPQHVLARVGLAECLFQQPGMDSEDPRIAFSEGEDILRKVLDEHPDLPDGHAALGYFRFFRQGAYDLAEESLRRAIALAPSLGKAHDWLAHVLLHTGRYSEAAVESTIAMDLDPLTPEFAVTSARAMLAENRFDEAETLFSEILQYAPENPLVAFWRTLSYHIQRQWGAAAAEIRRFADAASSSEYHEHWLWSRHHLCQGRLEQSEAEAREAVSLHPVDLAPPPNITLAEVLYHRRDYAASVGILGEAISAFGSDWGVKTHAFMRTWLGMSFERLGQYEEALRELQLAIDLFSWRYPWSVYWRDHWGDIQLLAESAIGVVNYHMGNWQMARRTLARLRLRGSETYSAAGIAFLCFQLGEIDEGFTWLGKASERRDRWLLTANTHPWFDDIRSDSRFSTVVKSMKAS